MTPTHAASRLVSAAYEGRILSGIVRRLSTLREPYWRLCTRRSAPTREADFVRQAMLEASKGARNRPSDAVRRIEGMSGQRYRTFINTLISLLGDDARYLEVGSWKGSTLASAIEGNRCCAVCIDNWSEFGGPKDEFLRNIGAIRTSANLKVIEADFRKVDYSALGIFNVFMFDGPHEEIDQYDGLMLAQPALANPHVLIVDDWNWRRVRVGTFRAIHDSGWRIMHAQEVRTTLDDSHPLLAGTLSDWHNGYLMAALSR